MSHATRVHVEKFVKDLREVTRALPVVDVVA
jgi:hypothetical protein